MIIIPQTKGGVGKSTVAMQVIAPYLYKKHGKKITYIEIDDENNDSRSFTRTEIVDKRMLGTNKITDLDELKNKDKIELKIDSKADLSQK